MVATPGRLADHIDSDPEGVGLLLSKIKFLVLDEADRILEGQYANSVKFTTTVAFYLLLHLVFNLSSERLIISFSR